MPSRSTGGNTYDTTGAAVLANHGWYQADAAIRCTTDLFKESNRQFDAIITDILKRKGLLDIEPSDFELEFVRNETANVQAKAQAFQTLMAAGLHPELAAAKSGISNDPVKDVKMSVPAEGTIDLAVENWWDNDDWTLGQGETVLAFGDVAKLGTGERAAAADQRLTIPAAASQEYVVSFTAVVYVSGLKAMEVQKTAVLKDVAFQMGKSYNIRVELNPDNLGLQPIVFDVVEVKDWVNGGEYSASVTM
jgi:hypothetical protein